MSGKINANKGVGPATNEQRILIVYFFTYGIMKLKDPLYVFFVRCGTN